LSDAISGLCDPWGKNQLGQGSTPNGDHCKNITLFESARQSVPKNHSLRVLDEALNGAVSLFQKYVISAQQ
jgi:hypothetical protein